MIRCDTAIVADLVIQDAARNSLSLVQILEELTGRGFPLVIPRFSMLFLVSREPTDPPTSQGTVRILLNDTVLLENRISIAFEDKYRHRMLLSVDGLVIPGTGVLRTTMTPDGGDTTTWATAINAEGAAQLTVVSPRGDMVYQVDRATFQVVSEPSQRPR